MINRTLGFLLYVGASLICNVQDPFMTLQAPLKQSAGYNQ